MRWPWSNREKRQASYSEAVSSALLSVASGVGNFKQTGAVEMAASTVGKALALSAVSPSDNRTSGLTPSLLASIGRQLVVRGEAVFVIEIRAGSVRLIPASSFDVSGDSLFPEDWTYRCDVSSPSASRTLTRPYEAVLHFRYSYDPGSPWRGVGPLTRARLTAALAANLESSLGNQAKAPTGQLIPVPGPGSSDDAGDDPLASLKADIANIAGGVMLTETMSSAWGKAAQSLRDPTGNSTKSGLIQVESRGRFGKRRQWRSCLPVGFRLRWCRRRRKGPGKEKGSGRFLNLTLMPLGAIVASELSEKLDVPVELNFDRLMASDLSGKARAFGSMVKAGLDLEKSASLSGLMVE